MDDINCTVDLLQRALRIEDIRLDEFAFQRLPVAEEFVSQVHEIESEICAVALFTVHAVGHELTDILRKCASEVEVDFLASSHPLENFIVIAMATDGEVQKAPLADAWVWMDLPAFLSLSMWLALNENATG